MSKHLDENSIVNELKGGSVFFQHKEDSPLAEPPPSAAIPNKEPLLPAASSPQESPPKEKISPLPESSSKVPSSISAPDSTHVAENASMHASKEENVIEEIRKTVKVIGKSELYVRLTPEEKSLLADIVYTYKRQGVKTSENEVSRIALNFLTADYQANGAASILAQVIEALLA